MHWTRLARDLSDDLLGLWLPRRCLVCGDAPISHDVRRRRERGLCPHCRRRLPPLVRNPCPRCGASRARLLPVGPVADATRTLGPCAACDDRPSGYRRIVAAHVYDHVVRDVLHRFKFDPEPALAALLTHWLAVAVRRAQLSGDLIVPVPLHRRRRRERGFDGVRALAAGLGRRCGIRSAPRALRRIRHTPTQVGRARAARERNVAGAFRGSPAIQGRRILVVDDILTTGATAAEVARALRRAGARTVDLCVVAKARRPSSR